MKRALRIAVFPALAILAPASDLPSQILQRLFGSKIDVVVIDHRGRPAANVPVGMQERDSRFPLMVFPARTGPDGRASLSVSGRLLSSEAPVIVGTGIPLLEPVQREIDPRTQKEPVRLLLPPTGQLRVIVYDGQERPQSGLQHVMLSPTASSTGAGPIRMFRDGVMEDDNAVFPYVGLGMEFDVTVQLEGVTGALRMRGKGPTRADEMVVLPLRTTTGPAIVALRMLDQDGEPVTDEVLATIVDNGQYYSGTETRTDAEGRLHLVVNESIRRNGEVTLTVWRRGEGELTRYRGAARVRLGGELQSGENDRGDLRLQEEPAIVTGRVVDPAGHPLADVTVSASFTYRSLRGGGMGGSRNFFQHQVRTDGDGSFTMRELGVEPAELLLNFHKEGYHYALEAVPSGAFDRQFVLDRAAGLEGSFADVPDRQAPGLSPFLVRADGGEIGPGLPYLEPLDLGKGAFRFADVAPGVYDLEVRLDEDAQAVYAVRDLQLEADQVLKDPRLQGIDWKHFCRFLTLTVLSPDQEPVPDVVVWSHHAKGNGWVGIGAHTDADGVASLFVPLRDARISMDVSGYRAVRLSGVVTDQTVTLKPRPVAEVRLQGELPEIEGVVMWPRLDSAGGGPGGESWGGVFGSSEARFDDAGVARIAVPAEGEFTLSLRIRLVRDGGSTVTSVLRRKVEILAGDEVKAVTLEIDDRAREEIMAAIERIRRRQ